jgi:hypothetical protein
MDRPMPNTDCFPYVKEQPHTQKAEKGFVLKSFNQRSFGVISGAVVTHVNRKKGTVTLDTGDKRETYRMDYPEWFVFPHGHQFAGQFFTFV